MHDAGKLTVYKLMNVSQPGRMPVEKLVKITDAYYDELTVGVTRAYAALSANQQIDMLVRCYNTTLPAAAEYAILEDGQQYRISLKQQNGDHVTLTLVRKDGDLDVLDEQA